MIRIMFLCIRRYWFLFFIFICVPASAENTEKGAQEDLSHEAVEYSTETEVYAQYIPKTSVAAVDGNVGVLKSGGAFSHEFKVVDILPVDAGIGFDYINIEETTPLYFPEELMRTEISFDTRFPFFNIRDVYAGVGVSTSFMCDSGSFGIDSFFMPTRGMLIYAPSKTLIVAAGVQFFSSIKSDIDPIGGIIYRPDDKWTFDVASSRPHIVYSLDKNWDLFLEGTYTFNEKYRVKKENDENVVLEYKETTIGGGFTFKIAEIINASFSMGGVFDRSLKYAEAGGKADIEKGYYIQGRGAMVF